MPKNVKYPGFSNFVRKRIEELGMTYDDVARRIGVGKNTVNNYANGYSAPVYPISRRLAKALGVEKGALDFLIEGGELLWGE